MYLNHGVSTVLRKDNVKEKQGETIKEMNREYMIKDQCTNLYHPQQNLLELGPGWQIKNKKYVAELLTKHYIRVCLQDCAQSTSFSKQNHLRMALTVDKII